MNDIYPSACDFNVILRQARFLLGDRWILIGYYTCNRQGFFLVANLPDIGKFFEDREHLDDGTMDWLHWGPRMN